MRVYIENYGCTNNQHLGERLEGMLVSRGLEIASNPENAQAIIINTCTVKGRTERRMLNRIDELHQRLGNRKLIIAGCMPTLQSDLIAEVAPGSMCFGTYEYHRIPDALVDGSGPRSDGQLAPMHRPGIGITPLSTGCMGECTFCIIRLIKGQLRSFPPERILEEVAGYRERGAHEIWLTSQDLANYGTEGDKGSLPKLLDSILGVAGEMKIRLGMMNPQNILPILEELLDAYEDPRIYKFAHIPVQSGSDRVLAHMGRSYSVEDWRNIISAMRDRHPPFTISTDVIVGYPGEGEDDFRSTLQLLDQARPDIVNISKYEHRPGTPASGMKALPGSEVKGRSREASRLVSRITGEANGAWIGWRGRALVSEKGSRGGYVARNDFYKPIILGENEMLGSMINVTITNANENYLVGSREG